MGHFIQAIIATPETLDHARSLGVATSPIPLAVGIAWLPMPDREIDRLAEATTLERSAWDQRFTYFGSVVPAIVSALSAHGPVAYVETEYFGGVGDQVATAFEGGIRILECGTVNEALRAIGVRAACGLDEWDTVGLAGHRRMPGD